jgi:hypothetical protein
MARKKLTEDEKEEIKAEGELPKKSVIKHEERQLIWFFVIVGVIFAAVLFSYFAVEGTKAFEFVGVDWRVEEYSDQLTMYHARFIALTNENLTYNLYLRNDPRTNDVLVNGTLNQFKHGGVISWTPEFDSCRGNAVIAMQDLNSFLASAVGLGPIVAGSTDSIVAAENERRYATCKTVLDRTLVILDKGDARVVQDEKNPYCYTIYIDDCDDSSPIDKFIIRTIEDFSKLIEIEKNSEAE